MVKNKKQKAILREVAENKYKEVKCAYCDLPISIHDRGISFLGGRVLAHYLCRRIYKKCHADFKKKLKENREEILYVLCYGLINNLTKKEEKSFMKMFKILYEDKLIERLEGQD